MNDASSAAASPRATARRLAPFLVLIAAAAVYAADQISKNWVVSHLTEGETVPVLGDFLQWHFVRNPGAAFSMASGSTWVFTVLAVVVVVVILWQIKRLGSFAWALFLGLLLGGVLGNLTDRLTRPPGFPEGHVVDFILTPWMWLGFNPAIYNVADIGIVSGMIIFLLMTLLGIPIDGTARAKKGVAGELDAEGDADSGAGTNTVAGVGTAVGTDEPCTGPSDASGGTTTTGEGGDSGNGTA